MVRGRTPARGTRRGAAAAGSRAQAVSGESSSSTPTTTSTTGTPAPAEIPITTSRSTPSTSIRGGASTRATRGPPVGRFKPKVVRRDEAERDSLARQEEQKANERAKEERKARGRSRFRSKRSRGDAMGSRGGFGRIISGASGPFSSGAGGSSGGGWFGGGGGGGGGFGGGGGGFSRSFKSESKPGFAQAQRYRETRINADKLNVNTPDEELDSEDEAMMAALSSRATQSMLPMGIYRREHKDAGVVVATTAELEAAANATGEEESLWVDSGEATPMADVPEDGVWDTDSKKPVVVKEEPGLDDSMDLDAQSKTPEELEEQEKKSVTETKPKKALPQDPEEKMIQTDLNLLANELGAVTITGEDGETTEGPSNKDGRMYLFQFPPLMPPLKQVATPKPKSLVKPEPEDTNMLDNTPDFGTTPVDLTEDTNYDSDANPDEDPENKHGFMSQLLNQGGLVGQIRVRKSGRVEMDWGGRTLELSPAAGMNFLTTAVIVEENDEKPKPGVIGGESIGMGKIMGRFILAPTWEEEEDWEVSPEELRIDDETV